MNLDWLAGQGLERLPQFLTALAIGLLIGLERGYFCREPGLHQVKFGPIHSIMPRPRSWVI